MELSALLSILLSLIFIGFFAGIETAFVTSNKLAIELKKKQGSYTGKIWGRFAEKPARFLGTLLVTFNIVLVIYGLLVGEMLLPIWNWLETKLPPTAAGNVKFIKLVIETFISTFIILLVVFSTRALFKAFNNGITKSRIISFILHVFYWLFSGIGGFIVKVAEWILKYILNVKIKEKRVGFNRVDLEHFMQQSKNTDEVENTDLNKELFDNALSLGDVKLRECMIPRKEIEGIESFAGMEEVNARFIETKLSKLIVYENNIDTIIGYIHQLDMFKNPRSVKEILLPIPTVPESMSATALMNKFSRERKTIAWVIDEFGGTAGIVTMEDLLEEIFGEIKDEYDDAEEFVDKQLSQEEYMFSGRLELDFISEKYKLNFPNQEGAETLSGYIIQHNEGIPKEKDRIIAGNYEFEIINVSNTRIEMVRLKELK